MASFEITGGKKLHGEITPQGAKNEALQILSATLLTGEKVTIHNIPDIRDVNKLILLLKEIGVRVEKKNSGTYTFQASEVDLEYMKTEDFKLNELVAEQDVATTSAADADDDDDGLTNTEEAEYGTDPDEPDTDGDGFLDGEEVKNGYNPLGDGKL